jgi:RHS repeat-associated protein
VRGLATAEYGNLVKKYERATYWGEVAPDTGTVVRMRMAGREYDQEVGLYYNRARYYDPQLGRFLSEDPAGMAAGLNLYVYAGNDPINAQDPSGMMVAPNPDGGGGGSHHGWDDPGDWNGDGMNDMWMYSEYAWGRQLWANSGQDLVKYEQVWWAIEHGMTDNGAKHAAISQLKFGRVHLYEPSAEDADDAGFSVRGHNFLNFNSSAWNEGFWKQLAFTLAHELAHYHDPDVWDPMNRPGQMCRGERAANRYAVNVTGYDEAGDYFPYYAKCPSGR